MVNTSNLMSDMKSSIDQAETELNFQSSSDESSQPNVSLNLQLSFFHIEVLKKMKKKTFKRKQNELITAIILKCMYGY